MLKGFLGIFLILSILAIPLVSAQLTGEEPLKPEKTWDKTYIIISLDNIKTIQDWNYLLKTLPKDHRGIMLMWYGITQNYQDDFKIAQEFINRYKQVYPDKQVIELWMESELPISENQTIKITTPVLENIDYLITFDNVKNMVEKIPQDTNVKIIASYVYEKKEVPVNSNTTTSNTTETQTVINEEPKWDELKQLKQTDSRLTGVMIYTNDNEELQNLIKRAKDEGFETYTIILPTPTLFGGTDMKMTYKNVLDSLQYYDYVIFYSWESITPLFNYYMSGGAGEGLSSEDVSEVGKTLGLIPELLLVLAIVGGISYIIIIRKKKTSEEAEKKTKKRTKKRKKRKKTEEKKEE